MRTLARLSDSLIPPLYRVAEGHTAVRSLAVRDRVQKWLGTLSRVRSIDARRAFEAAVPATSPLGAGELSILLGEFQSVHTRADRRSPAEKSQARLAELIRRTGIAKGQRALDIGCGEGSVTAALAWRGVRTTGLDLITQANANARKSPAKFIQGDAHDTGLPAASFDLIYSFDTLEHVDDPARLVDEARRLLAPGGVFYANFGPLWNSAQGAHQWMSVDIPYAHLLFEQELLDHAASRLGKRPMVRELNHYTLLQWRNFVADIKCKMNVSVAIEKFNTTHTQLITRFPEQFRRHTDSFDELVVRSIEIMAKKV